MIRKATKHFEEANRIICFTKVLADGQRQERCI